MPLSAFMPLCELVSLSMPLSTVSKDLYELYELEPLSVTISAVMPMYELDKLKELAYYFGEKSYPTTKMLFWQEVQDEGNDADKATFKPKLMHGVFKPFFPSVGKIVEMVFRGFVACLWNDDMPTRKGPEECSTG